jgi:hypothetical protein
VTADLLLFEASRTIANDGGSWMPLLQQLREAHRNGNFGPLGPVLHQGSAREGLMSLENAYFFAALLSYLLSGDCLAANIEVGATPAKDREVVENNRLLEKLRPPFSATFVGVTHGPDGSLRWSRPIWVARADRATPKRREILQIGSAPLEVGTISAVRVWMALVLDGVVLARWPYESKRITLLYHKARRSWALPPLELPESPRIRRRVKNLQTELRYSDKKAERMVARIVRQRFSRSDIKVRVLVDLEAREGEYIPRYVMLCAGGRSELLRPTDVAAPKRSAVPVTWSLLASTLGSTPRLLDMIQRGLEKLDRR